MLDDCAVISFWHPSAKLIKELEPRLQTGILEVGRPVEPVTLLRDAGADVYSPHWTGADPELVAMIHEAGGYVGVWTVDDDIAMQWMSVVKPDSIFTNRPREILPRLRG